MDKKRPIRTCIACRKAIEKKELIRIVKNGEEISLDMTGKKNGRGAYLCNDPSCFSLLKKGKLLKRAFKCNVPDEVYDKLMEDFIGTQK